MTKGENRAADRRILRRRLNRNNEPNPVIRRDYNGRWCVSNGGRSSEAER